MQEEMYAVCPHRNVPAAFQRFLGPDSGGIERFFPDMRAQRTDGTLLIARLRGKRALTSVLQTVSFAVGDFNAVLCGAWCSIASACFAFALRSGGDVMHVAGRTATLLFGTRPLRLPA